ncbi:MAG: radical SAM protein [Candidatus Omnitrophota bacterium]
MKTQSDFKVLLVYPNLSLMKIPSLAIALFTAILKNQGYIVDLFDASSYIRDKEGHDDRRIGSFQYRRLDKRLLNWNVKTDLVGDFIRKVSEFSPDIIIMSVVEDTFNQGVELLDAIKHLGIPNLIGGVFPTMSPEEAIEPECVQMVGIGEGEITIVKVCENIRNNISCENIFNLWFKRNDGTVIKNRLDKLVDINKTIPDYSLFEEDKFLRPWGGKIYKSLAIESMRGCPYECTFCNSPMHNKLARQAGEVSFVREKDTGALRKEIKSLTKYIQPEFFMFVDDTFLTRPGKLFHEWHEMYSEFKIPFWMNTRIEAITSEKLKMLKEVGCARISFSLEHGNEEFRKKYLKKYFSNEIFIKNANIAGESGIPFSIDVLIGLPFETRELIFDTIKIIRQVRNYDALTVNIFTPYRGTELREVVIQKGWLDRYKFPNGISGSSILSMDPDYLQNDEISGLFRTFTFYAYFAKEKWDQIKRAEINDEEGNRVFNELGKEYYQEKFGNEETIFYSKKYSRGTGCRAPEDSSI